MPNNSRIIVGIDVGTHKICTIVAESDPASGTRLNVLGAGAVASEGIGKGMIADILKASTSIEHSLEAAERQSGCRILSAYVSVSGNHISSLNSRGLVSVAHPDRVIGADDVARAVEAARAIALPAGRDLLHVIPRTYTIDGQEGIRNPVGLSGFRLDVETHVVMGASNVRENLIRCVQKANVEVDDLVLSPLASAEAVLTEQEKNLGVVHVDIGHGTTDIAIYVEGSVWHTKVLPIGGWQMTNDLVIVFNITYEAAEALKLQYGQAVAPNSIKHSKPAAPSANGKSHASVANHTAYTNGSHNSYTNGSGSGSGSGYGEYGTNGHAALAAMQAYTEDESEGELLEAETFEGAPRLIKRDEMNEVMAARLDQLFGMIGDEVRRSGYEGLLPAGVVLTGGVAAMPGIESLASQKLRMPVRIGRPKQIGGLADAFESPAYATSVGLILWGMKQGITPHVGTSRTPIGRPKVGEEQIGLLTKWLKKFLPQG